MYLEEKAEKEPGVQDCPSADEGSCSLCVVKGAAEIYKCHLKEQDPGELSLDRFSGLQPRLIFEQPNVLSLKRNVVEMMERQQTDPQNPNPFSGQASEENLDLGKRWLTCQLTPLHTTLTVLPEGTSKEQLTEEALRIFSLIQNFTHRKTTEYVAQSLPHS